MACMWLVGKKVAKCKKRHTTRHHILLKLKPEVTEEEIENLLHDLRALPKSCPMIKLAEFGRQDQAIDDARSSTVGGIVEFANTSDYEAYAKHPDHLALIKKEILPRLEVNGRAALQIHLE